MGLGRLAHRLASAVMRTRLAREVAGASKVFNKSVNTGSRRTFRGSRALRHLVAIAKRRGSAEIRDDALWHAAEKAIDMTFGLKGLVAEGVYIGGKAGVATGKEAWRYAKMRRNIGNRIRMQRAMHPIGILSPSHLRPERIRLRPPNGTTRFNQHLGVSTTYTRPNIFRGGTR